MPESSDDQTTGADLRARFDKLSSAIKTQRAGHEKNQMPKEGEGRFAEAGRGMNLGFRMVAEMIAGVLVGMGIGWVLDRWLGSKPYLMIVFLFVGMTAGILNVMRAAASVNRTGNNKSGS